MLQNLSYTGFFDASFTIHRQPAIMFPPRRRR